jgi:hypothetical protein
MRAVVIGLGTFARVHEYAGLPAKWGFARTRVRVAHDSAPCAFKTGAERRSGWRMRWSGSSSTTIRAQCDGVAAHVSAPWSSLAGLNVVVHAHRDHQDRIREPRFRWKSTSPRHDASPRAAGTTRRRGGGGLLPATVPGRGSVRLQPWKHTEPSHGLPRRTARAKPHLAGRPAYSCTPGKRSETDHDCTHGRSPMSPPGPTR